MTTNDEVLNSWKEVATYMGRGVRTVQRWEQELGLPVRRPRGKSRSAVIAFRSELDQWLRRAPGEILQQEQAVEHAPLRRTTPERATPQSQTKLHDNTTRLVGRTQVLLSRSSNLCEQLKNLREKIERTVHLTHVQLNARNPGVADALKPAAVKPVSAPGAEPLNKQHAIAS
jgi:ElaB/YqjD/DUF883 family membrane-anchored ribosome-binding protein